MSNPVTPESPRRRAERYAEAALSYEQALRALDEAVQRIRLNRDNEPHPYPPDASTEMALALARKALVADLSLATRYVEAAERYAVNPSDGLPQPRPSRPMRHTVT